MTEPQYNILKKHEFIWIKYKKDSTMVNIDFQSLKEMEQVYIELFKVRGVNLTCKDCVAAMIKQLYIQYDIYAVSKRK